MRAVIWLLTPKVYQRLRRAFGLNEVISELSVTPLRNGPVPVPEPASGAVTDRRL